MICSFSADHDGISLMAKRLVDPTVACVGQGCRIAIDGSGSIDRKDHVGPSNSGKMLANHGLNLGLAQLAGFWIEDLHASTVPLLVVRALVDRHPDVSPERLVGDLTPPPLFRSVSFQNYLPAEDQPTQHAALAAVVAFARRINEPVRKTWFRRAAPPEGRAGVYLDGGFGVGKTHLLAALWHAVEGPKAFGTFVEFTNLVGALGFEQTVTELSKVRLLAIDEFELDDPGDTVLMSTLLGRLVNAGVYLAATSNTLPDALGEGRFAAADFMREIQGLAAHFDVIRIDGEDYRHRGSPIAPNAVSSEEATSFAHTHDATVDNFDRILYHLGKIHPSKYGAMLDGVPAVVLQELHPLPDQNAALRFVVFADRLYDRQIPLRVTGQPLDALFTPEMMRGGYRKKYQRALSRLIALAR